MNLNADGNFLYATLTVNIFSIKETIALYESLPCMPTNESECR